MKKLSILTLLFVITVFPSKAQVLDEFRGLGRTGVFNETGLLKEWPENGPDLLWHIEDLPSGHSSMTIAYDLIYLTGMLDSTDYVVALNMDGTVKWQTEYGRSWNESFPKSRATPTIENERLYVTSGLGDIACLNAIDGSIVWKLNASEKFEGTFGPWGIAESLLIKDEKLYFTPGGNKTTMVALNKNTGETIWMTESLEDKPSYTSPLLLDRSPNHKLIINVTQSYIFAIHPDDGKLVWKFYFAPLAGEPYRANIHCNTPMYNSYGIFVSNGYNHRNIMLEMDDEWQNAYMKWSNEVLDTHHGGQVLIDGYIYGSNWHNNGMGYWVCMDWETGETMWETKWFNKGPIVAADNLLFCLDEKFGNIGIAKATPEEFKILSSFKIPYGKRGPFWSHPVIKDGILYVRHGDALMAYDIKDKSVQ